MTAVTTRPDLRTTAAAEQARRPALSGTARRSLAVLRILLGSIFLWAGLDKTFGLGFATTPDQAWIAGASPAGGYLASLEGALAPAFTAMAGNPAADLGYMFGMYGLGIALTFGFALRAAAAGGTVMMAMMWLSSLPLLNHPVVDYHLIYAAAMWVLALTGAGHTWGAARTWETLRPRQLRIMD